MYFVYSIKSEKNPKKYYVGLTTDIEQRVADHNAGKSVHTNRFRPWLLVSYTAFLDESKARDFEKYLKTSSGRAFSQKRL